MTSEIYRDEGFLEAPATVAYLTPQKGMDLALTIMEPQFAHPQKMARHHLRPQDRNLIES